MASNYYNPIPCHSTLFLNIPFIFGAPDEMYYEACTTQCDTTTTGTIYFSRSVNFRLGLPTQWGHNYKGWDYKG